MGFVVQSYKLHIVAVDGWRDSLVVSVLDLGSEGPRFEPVGRGWSRSKRKPVALCTIAWAYSTLHP